MTGSEKGLKWFLGAISGIGTILIAATQVPANQALKNLTSWENFGLLEFDKWGIRVGGALLSMSAFGWIIYLRHDAKPIHDWKTPTQAIDAFGNSFVLEERERYRLAADSADQRAKGADKAVRQIFKERPEGLTPATPNAIKEKYNTLMAEMSAAAMERDIAKGKVASAGELLARQISDDLERGMLIAKGFHYPDDKNGEIEIEQSRWRNLIVVPHSATAMRKNDGSVAFTGLLISQSKNKPRVV